jgi:hypothetical protein
VNVRRLSASVGGSLAASAGSLAASLGDNLAASLGGAGSFSTYSSGESTCKITTKLATPYSKTYT